MQACLRKLNIYIKVHQTDCYSSIEKRVSLGVAHYITATVESVPSIGQNLQLFTITVCLDQNTTRKQTLRKWY